MRRQSQFVFRLLLRNMTNHKNVTVIKTPQSPGFDGVLRKNVTVTKSVTVTKISIAFRLWWRFARLFVNFFISFKFACLNRLSPLHVLRLINSKINQIKNDVTGLNRLSALVAFALKDYRQREYWRHLCLNRLSALVAFCAVKLARQYEQIVTIVSIAFRLWWRFARFLRVN